MYRGVLTFNFDEFKIELRFSEDVEPGTDNIAPTISDVTTPTTGIVSVVFTENITTATMEDITNYTFNNGVVVTNAVQHAFQLSKVNLTVENIGTGLHMLTVAGCEDDAGNEVNDTFEFTSTINNVSVEESVFETVNIWSKASALNISGLNNMSVEVINGLGKTVYSNNNSSKISTKLIGGVYFVNISTANSSQVFKQIVE